jgi:Fe-S oxidoreductase
MFNLRPAISNAGFKPPEVFTRQAANILTMHNPSGAGQDKRLDWMPSDIKYSEEGHMGYWVGCAASYNYGLRNLPINAFRVLNAAGIVPVYLGEAEWCCGGAMFTTGFHDEVTESIEHNINELMKRGVRTLVTSCSGCWLHLGHYYPIFAARLGLDYKIKVKHITEVVGDLIGNGDIRCRAPVKLKVTYHDPCHIGRGGGIFEPPRRILSAIPGIEIIEMPRNREHAACCGRHVMRYPRLGTRINNSRVAEIDRTKASAVISSCPTCETNLRAGLDEMASDVEVIDIMDLVAASMNLPDLCVSKLAKVMQNKSV